MPSIVTKRFVQCHDRLKETGGIRSSRQFALELDYRPQNLNEILKGHRDAPLELIRLGIERFGINPTYLYTGEGMMFSEHNNSEGFRVLAVVTGDQDEEKIVHVPIPAQAGYSSEIIDPIFYQELPAYNLPDPCYQVGTFRSFDVSGDSMEPTLAEGDKVICEFVDPSDWHFSLKDNDVYVIVTRNRVLVKRVINQLNKHRHLHLISDNEAYEEMRLNVKDIRELWHLHSRINRFSHVRPLENVESQFSLDDLRATITDQSAVIARLTEQVAQMLNK